MVFCPVDEEYEELKMYSCRSSKSGGGNNFSEDALTEMAETRRLSSEIVGESCSEAPDPALERNQSPASALRERVALFSAQRQASDSFLLRNQHQPDCVRWVDVKKHFIMIMQLRKFTVSDA